MKVTSNTSCNFIMIRLMIILITAGFSSYACPAQKALTCIGPVFKNEKIEEHADQNKENHSWDPYSFIHSHISLSLIQIFFQGFYLFFDIRLIVVDFQ